MKLSDRLFGPLFMLLGAAVAAYGFSLPPMPGQAYGAGLFPVAIGGFLCLGGGVLAIAGWRRRQDEALIALADWARNRSDWINLAITFFSVLAFGLFLRQVGFAVLVAATTAVLLTRFGQPVWRALVAGVMGAAIFQYLFAGLMRVPLPPGILYGLIY